MYNQGARKNKSSQKVSLFVLYESSGWKNISMVSCTVFHFRAITPAPIFGSGGAASRLPKVARKSRKQSSPIELKTCPQESLRQRLLDVCLAKTGQAMLSQLKTLQWHCLQESPIAWGAARFRTGTSKEFRLDLSKIWDRLDPPPKGALAPKLPS